MKFLLKRITAAVLGNRYWLFFLICSRYKTIIIYHLFMYVWLISADQQSTSYPNCTFHGSVQSILPSMLTGSQLLLNPSHLTILTGRCIRSSHTSSYLNLRFHNSDCVILQKVKNVYFANTVMFKWRLRDRLFKECSECQAYLVIQHKVRNKLWNFMFFHAAICKWWIEPVRRAATFMLGSCHVLRVYIIVE